MKLPTVLDKIDQRILIELQKNGDLSNAALSERVGTSAPSCWRRVRALEEAGVLGPAVRLIDPKEIGLRIDVICHIKMKHHDLESRAKLEDFIGRSPEVVECFATSGEWDYLIRVVAPGIEEYNDFLMNQILLHPSVDTTASNFALKRVKYTTALPVGG